VPPQVKDLARLSLREPEYLSVHEDAQAATPYKLEQVRSSSLSSVEAYFVARRKH
jgi:hypothetical protein